MLHQGVAALQAAEGGADFFDVLVVGVSLAFLVHHLHEGRAYDTGRHGEDGYAEYAHNGGNEFATEGNGGVVGKTAGVADILGEGPGHGCEAVGVDFGLGRMLDVVEHYRQHEGDYHQKLQRHRHLGFFAGEGAGQDMGGAHVAEHAHQPEHAQDAQRRVGYRKYEREVERIGGYDVDQAVETEYIASASHPYAERDLDREHGYDNAVGGEKHALPAHGKVAERLDKRHKPADGYQRHDGASHGQLPACVAHRVVEKMAKCFFCH